MTTTAPHYRDGAWAPGPGPVEGACATQTVEEDWTDRVARWAPAFALQNEGPELASPDVGAASTVPSFAGDFDEEELTKPRRAPTPPLIRASSRSVPVGGPPPAVSRPRGPPRSGARSRTLPALGRRFVRPATARPRDGSSTARKNSFSRRPGPPSLKV
ncbi:hypothetical protein [Nocardiopsis sp. RV163]|uniref:hypothetical protein n=1 Tax=Nocardiopsis sp. RV163 TaxID=1661388 RepID=UPI001F15C1F2|nr:hypothetical protein [Nocardiopsis sp. RV163]